jgi:tellurite methyltransferase
MSDASVVRPITGFHQDDVQDWVAELSCGHNQHVRHKPPFWSRPWVLTPDGRNEKLGAELPCVLCDRFEMPAGCVAYKRTADFTATTIPAALTANHSTKRGVWGLLHVTHGTVRYVVEPPLARDMVVVPGTPAVIVPEILHRVTPDADASFYVEFHRRPAG